MDGTSKKCAVLLLLTCFWPARPAQAELTCPPKSRCECKLVDNFMVFSCLSQDEKLLDYTVTANETSLTMECGACNISYAKSMFGELGLSSDVSSVRFMNCPLPAVPFDEILGTVKPTELAVSMFHKSSHVDGSLFANLANVTRLTIQGGEKVSLDGNLLSDMPRLRDVDLSGNAMRKLPDGIFDGCAELRSVNLGGNDLSELPKTNGTLIKLETLTLSFNRFVEFPEDAFEFAPNLKYLGVSHNRLAILSSKIFRPLSNLESLDLSVNELDELPAELLHYNSKLVTLRLFLNKNLTKLPENLFANATLLKELGLSRNNFSALPDSLLSNLTELEHLDLSQNSLKEFPADFFKDTRNLLKIDLGVNQFAELPSGLFRNLTALRSVHLSNNLLKSIGREVFSGLPSLAHVDLSYNSIVVVDEKAFEGSDNLTWIDLYRNQIQFEEEPAFILPPRLAHLNVSFNNFTFLPNNWSAGKYLLNLNLSHNSIEGVNILQLDFRSRQIVVDLTNNRLQTINLNGMDKLKRREDEQAIDPYSPTFPTILVEDNPINCDCNLLSFVHFLKTRNLDPNVPFQFLASTLKCNLPKNAITTGQVLTTVDEDNLYCELVDDCNEKCTCRQTAISKITEVRCEGLAGWVHKMPNNVSKLYLRNNRIASLLPLEGLASVNLTEVDLSDNAIHELLYPVQLPRNLKLLALNGNGLSDLPHWLMEEISDRENLSVTLGNNSWVCDCTALKFHHWLTNVRAGKVLDLNEIKCGPGHLLGQKVASLAATDLCPHDGAGPASAILVTFLTVLILLAIAVVAAVCLFRHRFLIRIWLFRHKWCLWMQTEDDIEHGHPL